MIGYNLELFSSYCQKLLSSLLNKCTLSPCRQLLSTPLKFGDRLNRLFPLNGPKGKVQGVKHVEIELAIRHLKTEKSVFPEHGRADVTCSLLWWDTSLHLVGSGCPLHSYL